MSQKITQAGVYDVTVTAAVIGETDKGTPFLCLSLATEHGLSIDSYSYLSDAAFENSVRQLRKAFGFNNDFNDLDQFTGKPTTITVELELYNGQQRPRVKWLSQSNGPKPLTGAGSKIAALNAAAKRIPTTSPTPAPRPAAAPRPSAAPRPAPKNDFADDDSVPF